MNSTEITYLHIGKNAGNQIQHIARQLRKYGINIHRQQHHTKLFDLPTGSKYFFSIRRPVERFFSGFYSRKRKGQPLGFHEWAEHEKIAFETFEHANELAESLFDNGAIGRQARQAIKSIGHINTQQNDWFAGSAFLSARPPVTIIRVEHFETDMQRLLKLIGVYEDIKSLVTNDSTLAHKNTDVKIPPLSELAHANLEKWYIQDYYFYEMCSDWIEQTVLS